MTAIYFDEPSEGKAADSKPTLFLDNSKGPALVANTRPSGPGPVEGLPLTLSAFSDTVASFFASGTSWATGAFSRDDVGVVGVGATRLGAVTGLDMRGTASAYGGGYGVLGVTYRPASYAVGGLTKEERSSGVLGASETYDGVVGIGNYHGVRGEAGDGIGVAGGTLTGPAGVYGYHAGKSREGGAGVIGRATLGPGVIAESEVGPGLVASSEQAEGLIATASVLNAPAISATNDAGPAVAAASSSGTVVTALTYSGLALRAEAVSGRGLEVETFSAQCAAEIQNLAGPALEATTLAGDHAAKFLNMGGIAVDASTIAELSDNGIAVKGVGVLGAGVVGSSLTGFGVMGHSGSGWSGYFSGDVRVSGKIYKYASNFSIDHPLDPKGKVLNHSAIEGPEYKTFQDGIVKLDGKGRATVTLPDYFAALNTELRYQLTPLGAAAPDLHIAEPFANGAFTIAGGHSGQQICWQVTGVRQDHWAKANPLIVEQDRSELPPDPPLEDLAAHAKELQAKAAALKKQAEAARARKAPESAKKAPLRDLPDFAKAVGEERERHFATIKEADALAGELANLASGKSAAAR